MTFLRYCGIAVLIILSYVIVIVISFILFMLIISFAQSETYSPPSRRGQQADLSEMIIARPSGHERLRVSRVMPRAGNQRVLDIGIT